MIFMVSLFGTGMALIALDLSDYTHVTDQGIHHIADMTRYVNQSRPFALICQCCYSIRALIATVFIKGKKRKYFGIKTKSGTTAAFSVHQITFIVLIFWIPQH